MLKTLYLLRRADTSTASFELLVLAAQKAHILVEEITTDNFDFTQAAFYKSTLSNQDAVYCLSDDEGSRLVEKLFLQNPVRSFYSEPLVGLHKRGDIDDITSFIVHDKAQLPVIPTILGLSSDSNLLDSYAEYVGDYPLIIKAMGKSKGKGIIRVDSRESFVTIAGFLENTHEQFVIKKYIDHEEQIRMIVVGDQVIAHHTNIASHDFRSNYGPGNLRERMHKQYSEDIHQIAIKAVNSLGLAFGGVDILVEKQTGKPYIAEVNSPCYFPSTEKISGIPIAEKMIDYLQQKSVE